MSIELQRLLSETYFGNTAQAYLTAGVSFAAVLGTLYALRTVVLSRLKAWAESTETDIDDFVVSLIEQIKTPEYQFLSFYIAARALSLSGAIEKIIHIGFVLLLSYRAVRLLQASAAYGVRKATVPGEAADPATSAAVKSITFLLNVAIWVGGVVFVLDNLGINITALVAGLGIGGIAVALAAQAVLGDLFSSLTIYLDQPFVVGDFIVVGDSKGTVEHVGIKTTRVRSLDGELLVMSNSDLTSSRIRNFKRMLQRRAVFQVGVTYQTTSAKAAAIPAMIQEIIGAEPKATLERVHFKSFGDSALVYETVYWVLDPDYNVYMDVQQRINLALLARFEKEGIEFAYPTQTLFVQKLEPAGKA